MTEKRRVRRSLCFASALHLGVQGLAPIKSRSFIEGPDGGEFIVRTKFCHFFPNRRFGVVRTWRRLKDYVASKCTNLRKTSSLITTPEYPTAHTETDHAGAETDHAGAEIEHAGAEIEHAGAEIEHAGAEIEHAGAKSRLSAAVIKSRQQVYFQQIAEADRPAIERHMSACQTCQTKLDCPKVDFYIQIYLLPMYEALEDLEMMLETSLTKGLREEFLRRYHRYFLFYDRRYFFKSFYHEFINAEGTNKAIKQHEENFDELLSLLLKCERHLGATIGAVEA